MTVSTTYAPVQYNGNSVTTVFAFPYVFFEDSDLLVTLTLVSTGGDTVQVLDTDYTVTGGAGSDGSITFMTAPPTGTRVTIELDIPYTQSDDYVENQAFPAETLETGLDKAAVRDQQLKSSIGKALKYPPTLSGITDSSLPQPEDESLLAFDGITGKIKAVLLASLSMTGLNTLFTGLAAGDSFVYNGTVWVNRRLLAAKGTSIASATTTNIGAADSDFIDVTGTTTITSLGATTTRNHIWVNFTGVLTLTHNGTSLILPSNANITTAAGDVAEFIRISGSNWKCVTYMRQDGTVLDGAVSTAAKIADGIITYAKLAAAAYTVLISDIIAGTASKLVTAAAAKLMIPQRLTAVALSGTVVTVASAVPVGVTAFDLAIVGGSTNGTSTMLAQLGDSGGPETTGYNDALYGTISSSGGIAGANSTAGFPFPSAAAAATVSGILHFSLTDPTTNTWACSGVLGQTDSGVYRSINVAGSKSLSAVLTTVRLTMANGTDAFDAGTAQITYFYGAAA